MDYGFAGFSGSMDGSRFKNETGSPNQDLGGIANVFNLKDSTSHLDFNFDGPLDFPHVDPGDFGLSSVMSRDGDSPSDDFDSSETVLNSISKMLMDEDMEEMPFMFHDPLLVHAAEKSLYDVLGDKSPPSPNQSSSYGDQFLVHSPDDGLSSSFSGCSSNSSSTSNNSHSVDRQGNVEVGEFRPSFMQKPIPPNFVFQSTAKPSSQSSSKMHDRSKFDDNSLFGSSLGEIVVPNFFSESELALQFKRGVEEANKFLPKANQLLVNTETNGLTPESGVVETEGREYLSGLSKGKKSHEREDENAEEERDNKQSAVYVDEIELSEMFDKMLVGVGQICGQGCLYDEHPESEPSKTLQPDGQTNGAVVGKTRQKRQGSKKEVVDLRTLLILCAQAVSTNDYRTSNELLKQIRQNSSPFGDGSQRLAHYFASGLEARLSGTGTQIRGAISAKKVLAADMLKAYQAYLSACPFDKMAIAFANHHINMISQKAETLHIIDFGISYGFQWPSLIYRLAKRCGGPPKLRITGIELPQSGFRPAEGVQATGCRLAKYCERHNVPFEYNAIAQKWETIQIDDLKINRGEIVAVNCLFRFRNLFDETVTVDSPRDAVLNLIRKINPYIFVHAIVNGSYNAPFFVTRFREALFHFSSVFDMSDTIMPREDQVRMRFEKEFYGMEAMNVIACEGSERVERPETYKQWQIRNTRAGLKQLPLDPCVIEKMKLKVQAGYHSDFVVDQDGDWMLQGWKGRIFCASSAWIQPENKMAAQGAYFQ
ncbi:hypothetical protein K2173_015622 [Erythroxylum novogranatense]|uniref:Uncharacterized protein n=1 Tax=Erythroxylum novogranatense TaxID=1862640 RepID=A0AAV8SE63_9ROSI|nr:hypothetical protein K2173_015622 [Erythroxylum novogranatense]